jgi:hypothetical protein
MKGRASVLGFVASIALAAALGADSFVDQLGAAIRSGNVNLTFALARGKVPLTGAWSLETTGDPRAHLKADAADGRLTKLSFSVDGGDLIVAGAGLRPDVVVQSVEADDVHGITAARFHGRGFFGKIVIGLFRGVGMSAVKKMKLRTDLPSVFRGDIVVHEEKSNSGSASSPPAPAKSRADSAPPPAAGPSLFDLVRSIDITDSSLEAFPDRTLAFEPVFRLRTAPSGSAARVSIARATYVPARAGEPSRLDLDGEVEGSFVDGAMAYSGERLSFSSGELRRARIRMIDDGAGKSATSLAAERLALDLTSGRFLIGHFRVGVDAPSRFAASSLSISESGKISGILDLDLRGRTGEWNRNGITMSLANVSLRSKGLKIADNFATGGVSMAFDYRLVYPFTVRYPVADIEPKRVDLVFAGPLQAELALERAGDPAHGRAEGTYVLKVPWSPVERAAFEAMRARWSSNLAAIRKVDFTLEPSEFGPCGESCFVAKFKIVAEKKSGKRSIFRAECAPEGKANLVIDKDSGEMRLEHMTLEPHCEGLASIVNFIAPLFAKAYSDITLFKMPPDAPLTVDGVRSGAAWIELSGRIHWEEASKPAGSADSAGKLRGTD